MKVLSDYSKEYGFGVEWSKKQDINLHGYGGADG